MNLNVCNRRTLKVQTGKSKKLYLKGQMSRPLIFHRHREQQQRTQKCTTIWSGEEMMEKAIAFQYLEQYDVNMGEWQER